MDSDPEFGRLKRLQHRTFSSIIGAYGTDQARGRALDWDQVPDAEREAYFALGEQLQAFEQYWEYMDLEDQRSRIERDRPVLSAVEQYRRLAGEVEARNTVSRRRLDAAARQATPPEQTEDIARDLQSVDIPGRRPRLAAEQTPDAVRVLSQSAALPAATLREMNLQRWSTERSALRAADGSLQVLYHGTQAGEALTHFIPGGVDGVQLTGDAYGVASYFTSSPGEASAYGTDGAVFPVYIRGELLDLAAPELPVEEMTRLSAFANQVLLPADRARFPVGRRERRFTEEQLEEAKAFFQSCRDSWQRLGDGMERARPEVDKDGDEFIVRFTDFDAQVEIRTGEQAHTLFKAIGWDNLPAAGYDGMVMTREGGQRWVVMHRPSGNVKSAIGNSGEFNGFDLTSSTRWLVEVSSEARSALVETCPSRLRCSSMPTRAPSSMNQRMPTWRSSVIWRRVRAPLIRSCEGTGRRSRNGSALQRLAMTNPFPNRLTSSSPVAGRRTCERVSRRMMTCRASSSASASGCARSTGRSGICSSS